MANLKTTTTALAAAIFLLASASLCAQPQLPVEKPTADLPLKPVPPPKGKPIKRRSVQQVIEPTMPIVTEGYRPTLVIRPPAPLPGPARPPAAPRMNSCDAGGCNDTGGARYNSGVGNTLTGPQGQLCTRGPVTAQCF